MWENFFVRELRDIVKSFYEPITSSTGCCGDGDLDITWENGNDEGMVKLKDRVFWRDVRALQDTFNKELAGTTSVGKSIFFLKTQSKGETRSIWRHNKYEKRVVVSRWISIATTEEESDRLRNEPHIMGETGRVHEKINASCCWHPPEIMHQHGQNLHQNTTLLPKK